MNAIEHLRKKVVSDVMSLGTMQKVWPHWSSSIQEIINSNTVSSKNLIEIGNKLYDVFTSTSSGRGQSDVSGGGAAWEALVCWYLNLCLLGSRTVVIKAKKANIPTCLLNAISVNYGNFPSNTESDLLAVTFPESAELKEPFYGDFTKVMELCNSVVESKFTETELGIIQCKTNWNDNAQIPMLWDLIYASNGFSSAATVGRNGHSHKFLKKFTYSFATVPTVKPDKFKPTSTSVMRVRNLSGGNYWGLPSSMGIASNIFDIIQKNFDSSHNEYPNGWNHDITIHVNQMLDNDNYFKIETYR